MKDHLVKCAYIMLLFWGSFVSPVIAMDGGASDLRLFVLKEGVSMPFPRHPAFLGSMDQNGSTQHLYQITDEEMGMGFTATVMREPMHPGASPQATLKSFLRGTVEAMGGTIVSETEGVINGLPVRKLVIHMDHFRTLVRSHTVALYDRGKVHTWAMQDAPALTGTRAEEIFGSNVIRISGGEDKGTESFADPTLRSYTIADGVSMPFPATPRRADVQHGSGTLTTWSYMDRETGILFNAAAAAGLPPVTDPPASFLRGASRGNKVLDSGVVDISGRPAKFHVIESKNSGSIRHTYTVAFERAGVIYSWSVHEDPGIAGERSRDIFFREINRIVAP